MDQFGFPQKVKETPKGWTRRKWMTWAASSTLLAVGTTATYARYIEPFSVIEQHLEMPIKNLPASLEGKRMIQISDLHCGPRVDDRYLSNVMNQVSELSPDILLITGDFITSQPTGLWNRLERILKKLSTPPLGAYAVLGNHDYGEGYCDLQIAQQVTQLVQDNGIKVLRNNIVDLQGLKIAGLEDFWTSWHDPQPVLEELRTSDSPCLMLCHNPDAIDQPSWRNYQGWILSGHTHGGQCWFPGLGAPIVPVANKSYTQGLFSPQPGQHLYINPGIGYLRQLRFLVPPEITLFTLRRDESV